MILLLFGVLATHSQMLQKLHIKESRLLPVLHNLDPGVAARTVSLLGAHMNDVIPACSVSLRHASAMDALKESVRIRAENEYGLSHDRIAVGISTAMSEMQVLDAIHSGAKYISTMYHVKSLLDIARTCGTPMLSGVSSLEGAYEAIEDGTDALKIFPSSKVAPNELWNLLDSLRLTYGTSFMDSIPIIVAGGVKEESISEYISAGATGFAVGYDCHDLRTLNTFPTRVRSMTEYINRCFDAQALNPTIIATANKR